jgi:hypothetical protein
MFEICANNDTRLILTLQPNSSSMLLPSSVPRAAALRRGSQASSTTALGRALLRSELPPHTRIPWTNKTILTFLKKC